MQPYKKFITWIIVVIVISCCILGVKNWKNEKAKKTAQQQSVVSPKTTATTITDKADKVVRFKVGENWKEVSLVETGMSRYKFNNTGPVFVRADGRKLGDDDKDMRVQPGEDVSLGSARVLAFRSETDKEVEVNIFFYLQ